MQKDISVVLLVFNADIGKVILTLNSIIKQKDINVELIIADDGSDNYEEIMSRVESFLKKNDFLNYKILPRKNNIGTLKNAYMGVSVASNEYIKIISPGDALFCDTTLDKWLSFALDNDCDISGGYAVWYSKSDKKIMLLKKHQMPQNGGAYSSLGTKEEKIKSVVYDSDVFHGACMIVRKKVFEKYAQKMIDNGIVYAEDLFFRVAVFEGDNILLYPHNVIWYEFGHGISTSGSRMFSRLLKLDVRRINIMITDYIIRYKKEYSRYLSALSFAGNGMIGIIVDYVINPMKFKYILKRIINYKYTDTNVDSEFLRSCLQEK